MPHEIEPRPCTVIAPGQPARGHRVRLRSFWHLSRASYFLLDYILLWAATACAFEISPYQTGILTDALNSGELLLVGYAMPVFMALSLQLADLQRPQVGFRPPETIIRSLSALTIGMTGFAILHALFGFALIGRYIILFTLLYGTGFVVGSRMLLWKVAEQSRWNVLLYGTAATHELLRSMLKSFNLPIRLVGYTNLRQLPADPGEDALLEYCRSQGADEIVVDVPDTLAAEERRALSRCARIGISVSDLGLFFERSFDQVYVDGLRESWFWSYDPVHTQPWYFALKRFLDVALSVAGMLLSAPLIPLIALAIRLQDGGPVFYAQLRTGRHNRVFRMYKFRTMRLDAEADGVQWARRADARVTRVGRCLRGTRIDEIPQFWNILRGQMSFIGPRPERPEFVERIERELPFYGYRHLVKPGLTGWAQINFPYGASMDDTRRKLAYDLYYIKHASVAMDLLIVFRTIVAMVKGAR